MSSSEIKSENNGAEALSILIGIIHDISGVNREDISADSRIIDDLGVSSLNLIETIVHVEDTFGVRIEESDSKDFRTVQDVADFINTNRTQ